MNDFHRVFYAEYGMDRAVDIVLGAFAGFMAGLLGVGGGGMLVPLLASIFTAQGMNTENVVHLALGTSLTCMLVSSYKNFVCAGIGSPPVWGKLKNQIFLGNNELAQQLQSQIQAKPGEFQEIPRQGTMARPGH